MAWIYAIGMAGTSFVKIGFTNSAPVKRLQNLQSASPHALKLLKVYDCTDAPLIEQRIHQLLKPYQYRQEWFDVTLEQIDDAFRQAITPPPPPPPLLPVVAPHFFTRHDILAIIPISATTLWRWVRQGKFPQPRGTGGKLLWLRTDVEIWATEGKYPRR